MAFPRGQRLGLAISSPLGRQGWSGMENPGASSSREHKNHSPILFISLVQHLPFSEGLYYYHHQGGGCVSLHKPKTNC